MSLKNHVIDVDEQAEAVIEEIIDGFVGYDAKNKVIRFHPPAASLSNRAKILLYLAARRGWPFVLPEDFPLPGATPSEIEQQTGIPGGSLRPMLRHLTGEHMIVQTGTRYELLSHQLQNVKAELRKPDPLKAIDDEMAKPFGGKGRVKKASKKVSKHATRGSGVADGFKELLNNRWFEKGKTQSETYDELQTRAYSVSPTSLPFYLIKAVRAKQLRRSKEERGGNAVYVYYTSEVAS